MKKIIVLFSFLLLVTVSYSQSFEGVLTYKMDFELSEKMKKMGMTKEMLMQKMKADGSLSDSIKVAYKGGDYRTMFAPKKWSIYKAETNKIYTFDEAEDPEICVVTDAAIDLESEYTGKMPEIEKLKTTADINGVTCEIVMVKWKSGAYQYIYNAADLKVNPDLFSKHIYDGWAGFLKISKALPVRIIKDAGGMSITLDLVKKETKKIDNAMLTIPKLAADEDLNALKTKNMEVMKIVK
jgi:hypothetical protein